MLWGYGRFSKIGAWQAGSQGSVYAVIHTTFGERSVRVSLKVSKSDPEYAPGVMCLKP
jgi:hypothetical protein